MFETQYQQTPSPLNPLGAKGAGEVGTIPAAAAVISAIEDALRPYGVRITRCPMTPALLRELIEQAWDRGRLARSSPTLPSPASGGG
jgi:carbon-monoxide dehydrogenase large subunit